jgi:hypothetical protein
MPVDPTTTPIAGDPDSFPEQGYLPTDATKSFSGRYNSPMEVLFDRTAWNRRRQVGWEPLPLNGAADVTAQWTRVDAAGNRFGYLQAGLAPTARLSWYVRLPAHLLIKNIRAHLMGDDGSGTNTALPGVMPAINLYDQVLDGSAASLLYSASDPSTPLAVYDAYHNFTLNIPLAISYLNPFYYIIELAGHSGGGAGANTLKLLGIEIETGLRP